MKRELKKVHLLLKDYLLNHKIPEEDKENSIRELNNWITEYYYIPKLDKRYSHNLTLTTQKATKNLLIPTSKRKRRFINNKGAIATFMESDFTLEEMQEELSLVGGKWIEVKEFYDKK